jgi:hypothetical protein
MPGDEKREHIQVRSPWTQPTQKMPASRTTEVPGLPPVPTPHPDSERRLPLWSRILLALSSAIAVLSRPDMAAASPAGSISSPVTPTDHTQHNAETARLLADDAKHLADEARHLADEAIAADTSTTSDRQQSEFRELIVDAFDELRSWGADLLKDITKDWAKGAIEGAVMALLPPIIVKHLRRKPDNPIAKSKADDLEAFSAHRSEKPNEPVTPFVVMSLTGCTLAQAESTLHLAGYEAHGETWLVVKWIAGGEPTGPRHAQGMP